MYFPVVENGACAIYTGKGLSKKNIWTGPLTRFSFGIEKYLSLLGVGFLIVFGVQLH